MLKFKLKILVCIFAPKIIEKSFRNYTDAAEVLEVHLHVVGHVGVGELLGVVVVPAAEVIFKRKFFLYEYLMTNSIKYSSISFVNCL